MTVFLQQIRKDTRWEVLALIDGLPRLFENYWRPLNLGGPRWGHGNFRNQFFPAFWGFMAAVTEFFGGIFIALGLFTKPTALFLIITLFVAASLKFNSGGGLFEASHAIELGIVFLSLIFIGPGRYSIEKKVWPSPTQS